VHTGWQHCGERDGDEIGGECTLSGRHERGGEGRGVPSLAPALSSQMERKQSGPSYVLQNKEKERKKKDVMTIVMALAN